MSQVDRTERVRPIDWEPTPGGPGCIRVLDQTLLPGQEHYLRIDSVDELVEAIRRLAVRGAPALGVAGAMGVALAAERLDLPAARAAAGRLRAARPTAVNLARGVDLALAALGDGPRWPPSSVAPPWPSSSRSGWTDS